MQILVADLWNKLWLLAALICGCRWRSQRRRWCQQSNRCLIRFWSSTREEKLSGFQVMTANTHPTMSSQSIPACPVLQFHCPHKKCWIRRSHSQHGAGHFGDAISALTVSALGNFGISHYGASLNGAANALKQLRGVKQMSLSLFLNTVTEISGALSSTGRLFQMWGPWTAKLWSPYFVLVQGTTSSKVVTQVTTTSARWRRLTVWLQILWSHTMLTLVCQNCCLENDLPSDWQPMELT